MAQQIFITSSEIEAGPDNDLDDANVAKGTHSYTGDTAYYTGIVTPTSRSYPADLKYERIEFYMPAGSFK